MTEQKSSSTQRRLAVVIGGSGLVGGTIVNYFKTQTAGDIDVLAPNSKKLSLREPMDIRNYLLDTRPDFIINTAITNIDSNTQLAFEVNYLGALNLARAAVALGIPYIHLSSAATLHSGEDISETDCRPITAELSNYAKSKLMADKTLAHMHQHQGLDFTCVRLAVVYGNHDHKIQGFHRMLFSVADESMPFLFTKKGVKHSYSNCKRLPYFIHHILENREEFTGKTYNFCDAEPVELSDLILTIKSHLKLSQPKPLHVPLSVAKVGKNVVASLLGILRRVGLKAELPPELIFIRHFYTTQTLNSERLQQSSFVDPLPDETVYSCLPDMLNYYLTRWSHQNLINSFDEKIVLDRSIEECFKYRPMELLDAVHEDSNAPFTHMLQYSKGKWKPAAHLDNGSSSS